LKRIALVLALASSGLFPALAYGVNGIQVIDCLAEDVIEFVVLDGQAADLNPSPGIVEAQIECSVNEGGGQIRFRIRAQVVPGRLATLTLRDLVIDNPRGGTDIVLSSIVFLHAFDVDPACPAPCGLAPGTTSTASLNGFFTNVGGNRIVQAEVLFDPQIAVVTPDNRTELQPIPPGRIGPLTRSGVAIPPDVPFSGNAGPLTLPNLRARGQLGRIAFFLGEGDRIRVPGEGVVIETRAPELFRRGGSNGDGGVDLSDGVHVLNFLFRGGPAPQCRDAADANDDAEVDLSDSLYVFNYLFRGGPVPPPPGPVACGPDPSGDPLDCALYSAGC
jgi:hypothetical protein